jgi:deoxyribonuclease-4
MRSTESTKIERHDGMLRLGVHVSIAGGVAQAVERALHLGCTTFQVFTAASRRWAFDAVPQESAELFRLERARSGITPVIAHAPYLLNLASPDERVRQMSIRALDAEFRRCQQLGIELLVLHPGSCPPQERTTGIAHLCTALARMLAEYGSSPRLCLELTAGQGNALGSSLEELETMLGCLPDGDVGVCVDTCHALAAGYRLDLPEGYERFWEEFQRRFGWERLGVLHLNDSRYPAGSRRDRHEHIGLGYCGLECFRRILQEPRLRSIPMILETPKGEDEREDRINLSVLRRLARGEMLSEQELQQLWSQDGTL